MDHSRRLVAEASRTSLGRIAKREQGKSTRPSNSAPKGPRQLVTFNYWRNLCCEGESIRARISQSRVVDSSDIDDQVALAFARYRSG
jgi:hypothetical protein